MLECCDMTDTSHNILDVLYKGSGTRGKSLAPGLEQITPLFNRVLRHIVPTKSVL